MNDATLKALKEQSRDLKSILKAIAPLMKMLAEASGELQQTAELATHEYYRYLETTDFEAILDSQEALGKINELRQVVKEGDEQIGKLQTEQNLLSKHLSQLVTTIQDLARAADVSGNPPQIGSDFIGRDVKREILNVVSLASQIQHEYEARRKPVIEGQS